MTDFGRLRRAISSLIVWCVFLCLYVGGTAILALGLVFTGKTWWVVILQHASLWSRFVKTGEVLLLAVGLLLVLIIPFLQFRGLGRVTHWNDERSSRMKLKEPFAG